MTRLWERIKLLEDEKAPKQEFKYKLLSERTLLVIYNPQKLGIGRGKEYQQKLRNNLLTNKKRRERKQKKVKKAIHRGKNRYGCYSNK